MIYFKKEFADTRQRASWHAEDLSDLRSVAGTIQRVDYIKKDLTLIAEGRAWHFVLCASSGLWFDGRPAPFRCFQPLDHVRIFYQPALDGEDARALYLWAQDPATADPTSGN